MKVIKTVEAVDHVLCHDLTQIIRGETKGAHFRKGHIVTEEDVPVLLSMGKDTLYVWEKQPGMLHEDEGAELLWSMVKNTGLSPSPAKEGKIDVFAETDGLLKVDTERIRLVNSAGRMMLAVRHGDRPVHAGDKLAGTRIIPLVIEEEALLWVKEQVGPEPLLRILPYQIRRCAVVTTGNEVYHGRIQDTFTPVIQEKLAEYGAEMVWYTTLPDDHQAITVAIHNFLKQGAEMVLCSGGMSVDPDDKTPLAIRNTGADIVSYGAPVLPGAMFLLAYRNGVPIVGLPGCVMYARRTVFDLVLPRLLAKDSVTPAQLAALGEGGLCLSCPECVFPNCGFGTGR